MSDEQRKMGTVEPIFISTDKDERLGFLRGFVFKYADTNLPQKEIFEYLRDLTRTSYGETSASLSSGGQNPTA